LKGLDELPGWPDTIKEMQRQWIGKSTGTILSFNFTVSQPSFSFFIVLIIYMPPEQPDCAY
jgi:leucyl-tRNA synthetase